MNQDYIKQLMDYCPETGVCIRKERDVSLFNSQGSWKSWNTQWAGKVIDGVDKAASSGYIRFSIDKKAYQLHRLIFLYMTGSFPECVDHIDGNKLNNSWSNLRSASHCENMRNLPCYKNNKSGYAGVGYVKSTGKWRARIKINGKEVSLGHFDNIEEAVEARRQASFDNNYHENHGRSV